MASAAPAMSRFTIVGVVNRMVAEIRDNWRALLIVSVTTGLLNAALGALSLSEMVALMRPGDPTAALAMVASPYYWGGTLGSLVVGSFALAALLAVLVGNDGRAISVGEAFALGVRRFLPMLLLTVMWAVGLYIGLLLLVVPGLMLLAIWSVSAPALIAERANPFTAFGRSRALTKSYRWPVFGALVIFGIVYLVVVGTLQGGSTMGMVSVYRSSPAAAVGLAVVMSSIVGVLNASFLASLYRELRDAKEGGSESRLAEVFA